ncbi:MAG: Mg2+ and Co2+ transporter CorB [Clostridiales bacterium]|jgi:Mg2+/Co2+ transporter CorB|nr:Mg2+ and Co2+ transporter CorB [Clostridiales bacterium]
MKNNNKGYNWWPIKIFVLALALSLVFGFFSEIALDGANIFISIIVLVFFWVLSLLADLVGVAVTACDNVPFLAMASRKVKGAKSSLWLIKRQDKVANICGDIIGDISAIISGSVGAGFALVIAKNTSWNILVCSLVISSLIASCTVCGKAIIKSYAISNSHNIIKVAGKILLLFGIGKH